MNKNGGSHALFIQCLLFNLEMVMYSILNGEWLFFVGA